MNFVGGRGATCLKLYFQVVSKLFVLWHKLKRWPKSNMYVEREVLCLRQWNQAIALMGLFLCYKVAICPELLRTEGFPRMKGVIMNLLRYTSER